MWKSNEMGGARVEQAIKQLLPPCQIKCPINEDIQRTNVLISLLPDNMEAAKDGIIQIGDHLYEHNPFFNICGYICGLCELECNYKSRGGAIRRRLLKRFLSDTYTEYLKEKAEISVVKDRENVAVVGGGPSGLMAAFQLSRQGYRVTIFEASNRLGGALWLIPEYRLPREVLSTTLENLVRISGIDVRYNSKLGEGRTTIKRLFNDGYKAVFIAKGTPYARHLTFGKDIVEGQELSGVMYGLDFLYEVSHGNIKPDYFKNKKIIVIGAGNVAFDTARTARRLGGEVSMVCLECEDKSHRDGIPGDEDEIRAAWEEGIQIYASRGVRKITGKSGKFEMIDCPRCTSVYNETGFNPKFDTSDEISLNGDILIITIGQAPDRELLKKEGLLDEYGRLSVDPHTLQSQVNPSVFVGGDVRRVGFMVEAMKEGVEAAESISRHIKGDDLRMGRTKDFEAFGLPDRSAYKEPTDVLWIPPEQRLHFHMFEKGLTLQEAIEEAKRCTTCGPCVSCKACISIGFEKSLYAVEVDEARCSGCGACVNICNYESARLISRDGKLISDTDMFRCKSCGMCVAACPSDARKLAEDQTAERIHKACAELI
ncbi:MAG: FAD-dependent oxidoreductase [Dehalococcoidales bacterium]|jgi:NADPH-dependent glutamate synthase beta subunit-like oxidoreductase/ferredoxin